MKYSVRKFKSLEVALKELEPFVRDGKHIESGRAFKAMGEMRSREALGNLLLCMAVNSTGQRTLSFASDPIGGDGLLVDDDTGDVFPTEHVMVAKPRGGEAVDTHTLILNEIRKKCAKGAAYCSGKWLVVFTNSGTGKWSQNRVAKELPDPLHFEGVWVVSLQSAEADGSYVYAVAALDLSDGDAPVYVVRIAPEFKSWIVTPHQ